MKLQVKQYYVIRVFDSNIDRVGKQAEAEYTHGPFATQADAEESKFAHKWSAFKMKIACHTVEMDIIGE